jgi:hypothetical protein
MLAGVFNGAVRRLIEGGRQVPVSSTRRNG